MQWFLLSSRNAFVLSSHACLVFYLLAGPFYHMCRFPFPFQALLCPMSLPWVSLNIFSSFLGVFSTLVIKLFVHMLMAPNMSLQPGYLSWILNSATQLPTWHLNLNVHQTPQMPHHCTSYLWLQNNVSPHGKLGLAWLHGSDFHWLQLDNWSPLKKYWDWMVYEVHWLGLLGRVSFTWCPSRMARGSHVRKAVFWSQSMQIPKSDRGRC